MSPLIMATIFAVAAGLGAGAVLVAGRTAVVFSPGILSIGYLVGDLPSTVLAFAGYTVAGITTAVYTSGQENRQQRLRALGSTQVNRLLPNRSIQGRIKQSLLGDPRQVPSRLLRFLAFMFVLGVIAGVFIVLGQQSADAADSAGSSSYWLFNTLTAVVENPISIVGASLILYFRMFGLRRSWAATQAASETGWLVETVQQLSDEVRSMKGSSFLIVSSDDARGDIETAVDDGLDASDSGGTHGRERLDFHASIDDVVDVDREQWVDQDDVQAGARNAGNLAIQLAHEGTFTPTKSSAVTRREAGDSVRGGIGTDLDTDTITAPGGDADVDERSGADASDGREDVSWGTAAKEELHSLWLGLSASLNKGKIYWELGFPYLVAAWFQLIAAGFWVTPAVYLLVLGGTSPLIALTVFWVRGRLQDRRIQRHRTPSSGSFWRDTGARVKVVRAPDVTAYVGQTAGGRTYASYDREEFVTEFSLRLWEMTTQGEHVSPSILEQYARNLKQMKPNLHGHLANTELVSIRGEIADRVNGAQDEVVTKSALAYDVISPTPGRFNHDLGHDPKLVAEVYRQKVEESHSLAEITTMRETPDGREAELTLVYPTTKTRLPDMTELHSRFSKRFMGAVGQPVYELPEVDPREDLSGHVVAYDVQTQIQSQGELSSVPSPADN